VTKRDAFKAHDSNKIKDDKKPKKRKRG